MTAPYTLHRGDSLLVLRTLLACSIDAIGTDPPYGLTENKKGGSGVASVNLESPYGRARIGAGNGAGGFMGMKWDHAVPGAELWAECLRVLKPGGYLLAFAGTRTQHRMACNIEDAGFVIRDMIAWVYGSGFPKNRNFAEIDLAGDDAEAWAGWGTALKPALEPITVARKPLQIGYTVARNVVEHGTGAFNIDACRVLVEGEERKPNTGCGGIPMRHKVDEAREAGVVAPPHALGRFPANVVHDGSDEVVTAFPDATGQKADIDVTAPSARLSRVYAGGPLQREGEDSADSKNNGAVGFKMRPGARRLDEGSAARFFYCAKASNSDRNEGLAGLPQRVAGMVSNTSGQHMTRRDAEYSAPLVANHHPTVKPTDLMRWLARLVTPPGGLVLDPFMGSGSTGKACMLEGFRFVGVDLDDDGTGAPLGYIDIARARIEAAHAEYLASTAQSDLF